MRRSNARPPTFLLELMPIVDRRRDAERGRGTLRAILGVAQSAFELLESDIGRLYDNWFVETCEPRILPYLADLVAIPRTLSVERPAADLRRLVANVVDYRRRKGTARALAEIASDVSGWTVRVTEATATLARTPNVRLPERALPRWAAVRDAVATSDLGGPFDTGAHTVDVRGNDARGARAAGNPREIALYAWRALPNTLAEVSAYDLGDGRYTFDPLGYDARLINPPVWNGSPERAVPAPLRNSQLRDELIPGAKPVFLDVRNAAFAIEVTCNGERRRLTRDELDFADLRRWRRPQRELALIDVERGRFVLDPSCTWPRVDATWATGGDVGGGAYRLTNGTRLTGDVHELVVSRDPIETVQRFATLQAAFDRLAVLAGPVRIMLCDSGTYAAPKDGWTLRVGGNVDHVEILASAGTRPVLDGSLRLEVEVSGARIRLDGLLLTGSLRIDTRADADDVRLSVTDTTIVPRDGPALETTSPLLDASIRLHRTMCGRIRLPALGTQLHILDSIVDGRGQAAIAGAFGDGPQTTLERCTVLGGIDVFAVEIAESIVTGEVQVRAGDASSVMHAIVARADGVDRTEAVRFAVPRFVSRRYGTAGYARLRLDDDPFALGGARSGEELGAFHTAATGRRVANLNAVLAEYVPYGVRAGVIDEG